MLSIWNKYKKLFIGVAIALLVVFGIYWYKSGSTKKTTTQTTEAVTRGTLVSSISASGTVSSVNNAGVTTAASGVVKKTFVNNGDMVATGDQIAQIDLDLEAKQKYSSALASYQSAKNSLDSAKAALFTTQSDMFTKWKSYMDLAQSGMYQNSDGSPRNDNRQLPQYMSPNDDWLAAEAKYKIAQNAVTAAQNSLNSSWLSLQQLSPIIYAPITGVVTGLSLQPGSVIPSATVIQKVASIKTDAIPVISINLTEIDVSKVKVGDEATLTLDAFTQKTYTGRVVSIDTVGQISSGVATYPTVIAFDNKVESILPNMSAQANIVIETKDNVLAVSNSAIKSDSGRDFVEVVRNGKTEQIDVRIGISSDSQTEIVSGLNDGDVIVTGTTTPSTTNTATSPFSIFGGNTRNRNLR